MVNKLLIVEDDPGIQSQLRWCFEGFDVFMADDPKSAMEQLRRHHPPVITLDLGLPPDPANASVGLELLKEMVAELPDSKIIVVTGNEDRDNAIKAIAMGAYDFYQKPIDPDILGLIVNRARHVHELEEENRQLQKQRETGTGLTGIIASSPQMLRVCGTIERVAPADVTTLLLGESGTGKELLARALHDLSSRADKPFVAVNSAAIPETLLESELYGHEKGAFTGAAKQTKGKIEYAQGGTFFLDEVGDLPMALQAKLLRFLQERAIERVGGRELIPIDVRVVCATHHDLNTLIEEGRFRQDLFFRISEVTIRIPPLRDREGDALVLGRMFMEKAAQQHNRSLRGFSKDALIALENYAWPGNVRELENRVRRAVIMAEGPQISSRDLELDDSRPAIPFDLREAREAAERKAIVRALNHANDNLSKASDLLGVTRPTLYSLLSKFEMRP